MAPEQALNSEVDGRADLYSLGIMLYEMLSGTKPFTGGVLSLIHHHLATPPPPLKALPRLPDQLPGGALPEAGHAVVMKLLAKKPEERYADAGALVAAIDAALSVPLEPGANHAAVGASRASSAHEAVATPAPPTPVPAPLPTPAERRGLARWALLGIPLALLLGFATLAALRTPPRERAVPGPVAALPRAPLPPSPLAPDAQLAPALLAGASALELLSSQFPADPRILRALARAYATQNNHTAAARTVGRLLALTPEASADPELGRILSTAALGSAAALGPVIEILEGSMGERGVDLLLDLNNRIQTKPGKLRLAASLAKPAVRAHASPATLLVLDLHAATRCDTRHALLGRAKQFGDHRALTLLRPLERRDGCGFLNLGDCWPCLHQDAALRVAIAAIEARQSHPTAASH